MVMKEYSIYFISPILKPHNQMQFGFIPRTPIFGWDFIALQGIKLAYSTLYQQSGYYIRNLRGLLRKINSIDLLILMFKIILHIYRTFYFFSVDFLRVIACLITHLTSGSIGIRCLRKKPDEKYFEIILNLIIFQQINKYYSIRAVLTFFFSWFSGNFLRPGNLWDKMNSSKDDTWVRQWRYK